MQQMLYLFQHEWKGEAQSHTMFSWIRERHTGTQGLYEEGLQIFYITNIQRYCKMQFLEAGNWSKLKEENE